MEKDLDRLLNELSNIERDPTQKKKSFQKLSERIHDDKNLGKKLNSWKPAFTLILVGLVCCIYLLTMQSQPPMQHTVRGEKINEIFDREDSYLQTMTLSSSHSIRSFPTGNPTYYFGVHKNVNPFSSVAIKKENLLLSAKPVKSIHLQNHSTIIKDSQVKYLRNNYEGILFLKFVFLADNTDLLYVKDVKANQWYKIEGESAERLQEFRYYHIPYGGLDLLYFLTGIIVMTYLINLIIKDKNPILKRTSRYINSQHKRTERLIILVCTVILNGILYYMGFVHILVFLVLTFIILGYRLYMELKYRPETKYYYLIINSIVQVVIFFLGFLWLY